MNSKMPTVYVHYLGTESAKKILEAKGIINRGGQTTNVLRSKACPNCNEPNKPDAKYCAKCQMVMSYDAYIETKAHELDVEGMKEEIRTIREEQMELRELLRHPDKLEEIAGPKGN